MYACSLGKQRFSSSTIRSKSSGIAILMRVVYCMGLSTRISSNSFFLEVSYRDFYIVNHVSFIVI